MSHRADGAPRGQLLASARTHLRRGFTWLRSSSPVEGLFLSVGTLSLLPAPIPKRVDRAVTGWAMLLAPLVGVLIGATPAAVVAGIYAVRPDAPWLAAVAGIVVLVIVTGALHLDGLADFVDALGSRRDTAGMLRIMKQGDIGPFGVTAIVAVLLLDVAALAACVTAGIGWQATLIACTAGRSTLAWACRTGVPAARPEGLGATVADTVRPWKAAISTVLVIATAVALLFLTASGLATLILGGAAVLVGVAAGLALVRWAQKALGGITGDVLGATVEAATAAALLTLALTP